jgi:hypothetical protein
MEGWRRGERRGARVEGRGEKRQNGNGDAPLRSRLGQGNGGGHRAFSGKPKATAVVEGARAERQRQRQCRMQNDECRISGAAVLSTPPAPACRARAVAATATRWALGPVSHGWASQPWHTGMAIGGHNTAGFAWPWHTGNGGRGKNGKTAKRRRSLTESGSDTATAAGDRRHAARLGKPAVAHGESRRRPQHGRLRLAVAHGYGRRRPIARLTCRVRRPGTQVVGAGIGGARARPAAYAAGSNDITHAAFYSLQSILAVTPP